jgi:hypothetical protein
MLFALAFPHIIEGKIGVKRSKYVNTFSRNLSIQFSLNPKIQCSIVSLYELAGPVDDLGSQMNSLLRFASILIAVDRGVVVVGIPHVNVKTYNSLK